MKINRKRISFILPFVATKPVGGVKIIYQYANELAKKGHQVTVYHAIEKFERHSFLPSYIKLIIYKLRQVERPSWFTLSPLVESKIITNVSDRNLQDADVVLSTWWGLAFLIERLSPSKGKKFNLIQGYEIWKGNTDMVHQSYSIQQLNHIVISRYLSDLVNEHLGRTPLYLPNAIDLNTFKITVPLEERNKASVCMLFSRDTIKGTEFGLKALTNVKEKIPELVVDLFSVYAKPDNLPDWIHFHQKPPNLPEVYNRNAIFLSPSLTEGWALPPAEAMACGCAVVCTDIGGHHDYAIKDKTALLVQVEDHDDIAEKLLALIVNDNLRLKLAASGNTYLKENFNLKRSVLMLEEYFETC